MWITAKFKKKPKWASLCSVAFTDSKGRSYYVYRDDMDMGILRKGEIEKALMELRYGSDLEDILAAMQSAMGASDKKGNMTPDLSMMGYLVQELTDRRQMLLVPEIMFKIIATTYIREDENPAIIDEEILEEKMETFKAEIQQGGLHDFFHASGLTQWLGLSTISIADFKKRMTESVQRLQRLNRILFSSGSRLQHG